MKTIFNLWKVTIIACLSFFCFSCNQEDMFNSGSDENDSPEFEVVQIPVTKLKSSGIQDATKDEYVLKFRDEDSYNKLMSKLELMSQEERLEWDKQFANFSSTAQEYEKAMEEAESYYDRPGGYEEFKEKYSNLYFPEEGDDYGAYIPYKNDLEAFISNGNGRFMVDKEIINLDRINSYDQLVESGRGITEEESTDVYDSETENPISESLLKSSVNNMPTIDELKKRSKIKAVFLVPPGSWWFEKRVIGGDRWRHSTGWRRYGDRKIKLNFNRETRNNYYLAVLPGGFKLEWHFEVSFRKKGFLGGWYNYSSKTETSVNIQYFNENGNSINYRQIMKLSHTGTSSHDMWSECTVFRYIQPQKDSWMNLYGYDSDKRIDFVRCLYLMPAYWADFTIKYRGIDKELKFAFSAPALFGYTDYVSDKLNWDGPI
jgi:hypothetical protein